MTSSPRSDDDRRSSFIQWSAPSRAGRISPGLTDPGFVVNRRRLYRYLASLESFSGE